MKQGTVSMNRVLFQQIGYHFNKTRYCFNETGYYSVEIRYHFIIIGYCFDETGYCFSETGYHFTKKVPFQWKRILFHTVWPDSFSTMSGLNDWLLGLFIESGRYSMILIIGVGGWQWALPAPTQEASGQVWVDSYVSSSWWCGKVACLVVIEQRVHDAIGSNSIWCPVEDKMRSGKLVQLSGAGGMEDVNECCTWPRMESAHFSMASGEKSEKAWCNPSSLLEGRVKWWYQSIDHGGCWVGALDFVGVFLWWFEYHAVEILESF